MNKKFSVIIILVVIILTISACTTEAKPEETISRFVQAMKNFDFELMVEEINPVDLDSREDFSNLDGDEEDLFQESFLGYMKSNAKKISYEIIESEIDGDNAIVKVNFKYIDGGPLFKSTFAEYIKEVFALAFTNMELTDEENSEIFMKIMEEQNELVEETFVEKTLDITLF